jgi:hypothetical protein
MKKHSLTFIFYVGLLWTAQNGLWSEGICDTPEKQECNNLCKPPQLKYRDLIRRLR